MNNNDRNIRTLIMCFVISLVVLIPLRFVEYGNQQPQVLGESQNVLILPNANIDTKNAIELSSCIESSEAENKINDLVNLYVNSQVSKIEAEEILREIEDIEINKCQ